MQHWPWWLGAVFMAAVPLSYAFFVRRPFGAAGAVGAALDLEQRRQEREAAAISPAALEAALLAATQAQFGASPTSSATAADASPSASSPTVGRLGWGRSVALLLGFVVGGVAAGSLAGMPAELVPMRMHAQLFEGPLVFAALFVGGIFVGAGTAMGAGCTSGHGLVGVPRLQVASLVATAAFFGTGIAVSIALRAVLGGSE